MVPSVAAEIVRVHKGILAFWERADRLSGRGDVVALDLHGRGVSLPAASLN
jgi:hypothetical protein